MIVRILRGLDAGILDEPPDRYPDTGADDRRLRLARAAGRVNGLETLIVGWDGRSTADASFPSVVAIAWRDAEAMVAASGRDEMAFLRDRLGVHLEVARAETYEVMSRTFASLPTPRSVLRILTIEAKSGTDAALFERLREIQRDLTDRGLIASHVARRVAPDRIEALVVGVWRDHDAIAEVTDGRPGDPAFVDRIQPFMGRVEVDKYEAMEIAPRLPLASGPPILILDGAGRIVDVTPSGAAALGRTQDEAVGLRLDELTGNGDANRTTWAGVLGDPAGADSAFGEAAWTVPSGGHVFLRWYLRRDVPVLGRHTILVRRRQDPPPTAADLDAALAEAFPRDASLIGS